MRPIVSELPPAANGDTIRTGFLGQSCALAGAPGTHRAVSRPKPTSALMAERRSLTVALVVTASVMLGVYSGADCGADGHRPCSRLLSFIAGSAHRCQICW